MNAHRRKSRNEFKNCGEKRANYRSIFENAIEGFYQSTPEGQFLVVNAALARILGYDSPEDLLGHVQDINSQYYACPERRNDFRKLLESEGIIQNFESEVLRKDGGKIWVSTTARIVRNEKGGTLYYEGIVRDISDHKMTAEALKRSEEEARKLAADKMVMAEIGRVIGSTLNIEEVYERFAQETRKLLDFDRIAINLIDEKKWMAISAYVSGREVPGRGAGDIFSLAGSANEEILRTQKTVIVLPV